MNFIIELKILFYLLLLISNLSANEGPLQYPEPPGGWDEGECKSNQIQSPIDIPSIQDNSVILDDGSHAKIKSLFFLIYLMESLNLINAISGQLMN